MRPNTILAFAGLVAALSLAPRAVAAEVCREKLGAYDRETEAEARKKAIEPVLTSCADALKASDATLRKLGATVLTACERFKSTETEWRSCQVDAYRLLLHFQY